MLPRNLSYSGIRIRKGDYMEVIKRDGRRVSFDKEKIRVAVKKAFNEVE